MTTCDNDHDPITFEGEFRALCPLCAMRLKLAEAEEAALESAADAIAAEELARLNVQGERDDLRDRLDRAEQDRDGWKQRAEELQAELDNK